MADRTVHQRAMIARRLFLEHGTLVLTQRQILDWLQPYKGWTRRTYQNHFISLGKWAMEAGLASSNPVTAIRPAPSPRPRPKPLLEEEVDVLLTHATGDVRAWLLLGLYAGIRRFEIAKFRGLDISQRSINLVGKGGQAEMVPTHPVLWEARPGLPPPRLLVPPRGRRSHHDRQDQPGDPQGSTRPTGSAATSTAPGPPTAPGCSGPAPTSRSSRSLLRHRTLSSTEHYVHAARDEAGEAIHLLPPAA
ncbi:hypothetical protein G5V59_00085 [Nocardioides sp. W3-2-3]|uniref:hypothetical protein n=1 Tax=Nocardioides convexus TaxID=2712224 RepID=UPI00241885CA|nr:hypothetical protein [Nocardioides convexus]NGZ99372.1 hypothetical protein [Nocardioides convexus]